MLQLNNLEKITKKRKRVGRGGAKGGTSGKGHKGQNARSGGGVKAFFEGGQMALTRRLPRRGFTNSFKKNVKIVNIIDLETFFASGDTVNEETLRANGLIKGKIRCSIKILGNGELTKKLTVVSDACSKGAALAIEKAGGQVQLSKENSGGSITP